MATCWCFSIFISVLKNSSADEKAFSRNVLLFTGQSHLPLQFQQLCSLLAECFFSAESELEALCTALVVNNGTRVYLHASVHGFCNLISAEDLLRRVPSVVGRRVVPAAKPCCMASEKEASSTQNHDSVTSSIMVSAAVVDAPADVCASKAGLTLDQVVVLDDDVVIAAAAPVESASDPTLGPSGISVTLPLDESQSHGPENSGSPSKSDDCTLSKRAHSDASTVLASDLPAIRVVAFVQTAADTRVISSGDLSVAPAVLSIAAAPAGALDSTKLDAGSEAALEAAPTSNLVYGSAAIESRLAPIKFHNGEIEAGVPFEEDCKPGSRGAPPAIEMTKDISGSASGKSKAPFLKASSVSSVASKGDFGARQKRFNAAVEKVCFDFGRCPL